MFFFFFQSTAAATYGKKGDPANNLIKVNVYYTSLNEKTTEDVVDYNIEVCRLWNQILNEINNLPEEFRFSKIIQFATGRKYVQRLGRLSVSLAWHLILQPLWNPWAGPRPCWKYPQLDGWKDYRKGNKSPLNSNMIYVVYLSPILKSFKNIISILIRNFLTPWVGGCLSLWLGISFCNLFEIIELFLDFLGNILNRTARKVIGRANNPL